jgi:hypothetical protein
MKLGSCQRHPKFCLQLATTLHHNKTSLYWHELAASTKVLDSSWRSGRGRWNMLETLVIMLMKQNAALEARQDNCLHNQYIPSDCSEWSDSVDVKTCHYAFYFAKHGRL